jgi:hypothetical protein
MSRVTALRRLLIGATAALILFVSTPPESSAQGQPAVVEGTSQLFIRRGPGREFPPFATLTGGSQVQLQERHGTWARVTTASGQVGYVHSKYLRLLKNETPAAPTAATPLPPTTVAAPTRTAQPPSTATRRQAPERTATTSVEATPTASPEFTFTHVPTETPAPAIARPRGTNVQREIERLGEAVEALNRRLDQRFPLPEGGTAPPLESDNGVSGGAILLGLAGVIVGWFLGSTYQRNKERGRRSRIRL